MSRDNNAMARLLARGPKAPPAPARPLTIEQLAEYFDVPLDLVEAVARYPDLPEGISAAQWEQCVADHLRQVERWVFGASGIEPVGLSVAFNDRP